MRPPGGGSSIFNDEPDRAANGGQRPYRMASSFELGDEQPPQDQLANQVNRRRSKPSGE